MSNQAEHQKEELLQELTNEVKLVIFDLLSMYLMLMEKGVLSLPDIATNCSKAMTRLVLDSVLDKAEN